MFIKLLLKFMVNINVLHLVRKLFSPTEQHFYYNTSDVTGHLSGQTQLCNLPLEQSCVPVGLVYCPLFLVSILVWFGDGSELLNQCSWTTGLLFWLLPRWQHWQQVKNPFCILLLAVKK
jgi:hypothetical protein